MQDPERAAARAAAQPDKGWDYDIGADPTEGLRRAIAERLARCQDFTFATKRPGQTDKTLVCDANQYPNIHLRSLKGFLAAGRQMPPVRHSTGIERLSPQLAEPQLFSRFMREFGGESSADFTDVIGNVLVIDRNLFLNLKGEWKMMKGERAPWLLYTAANIQRPDEIWKEPGRQGGPDKLYYLSRFDVGRRGLLACIAVFEREQKSLGAWSGITNYATTDEKYIYRKRDKEIMNGEVKYWRWE